MTGERYVQEVREWLGTPFLHAASEKGKHCDCIGLIVGAARELGMETPLLPEYGGLVPAEIMWQISSTWGIPIPRNPVQWQAGDILQISLRGNPQHFGVFSGENTFIHAGFHVVRETRLDSRWESRVVYVWRWKEIARCKSS